MKSIAASFIIVFLVLNISCQKENNNTPDCKVEKFGFYTINHTTMQLCFVDTAGNILTIGGAGLPQTTLNYHSLEFDNAGNLWFLYNNVMYLVNKQNGYLQGTKTINSLPLNNSVPLGFSFDNSNRLTICNEVTNIGPGTIYNIDNFALGNAVACPNSTGVSSILGIEYDNSNNLWAIDECCNRKLSKIDIVSGKAIPNSFNSFSLKGTPSDLDFSNGIMYGISINASTTDFFRVDLATGISKTLFTLNGTYMGIAGSKR